MALKTVLFALIVGSGSPGSAPTVDLTQYQISEGGFSNMTECRKLEASMHTGPVVQMENKKVSYATVSNGLVETKTWCVEY